MLAFQVLLMVICEHKEPHASYKSQGWIRRDGRVERVAIEGVGEGGEYVQHTLHGILKELIKIYLK